jgi:hypothetical protein
MALVLSEKKSPRSQEKEEKKANFEFLHLKMVQSKRIAVKPKTKAAKSNGREVLEIFPKQIQTQADSLLSIKRLIALAISNIAYLRVLFPEGCFQDRSFEDLHVKIIKDSHPKFPKLKKLSNWLIGLFDAIEKKYVSLTQLSKARIPIF